MFGFRNKSAAVIHPQGRFDFRGWGFFPNLFVFRKTWLTSSRFRMTFVTPGPWWKALANKQGSAAHSCSKWN